MKHVVIIGGGAIGMCSAYYLRRDGHKVTIIDQGDMMSGCSYGNAGMIVPSHFIPLAAPGMISKGVRWMFRSTSPFYVRPSISRALLRWGWLFYRSSTHEKVEAAAPALRDLSLLSKQCYASFANDLGIDVQERGLLMLYRRKETGEEELETVEMAHRLGMKAKAMTSEEVQALEPNVRVRALGGIFFPGDSHVTPSALMSILRANLIQNQVHIVTGQPVVGFDARRRAVKSVFTDTGKYTCDEVVLAAGAWSPGVASKLGLTLPMQAGKGYSFTLRNVDKNVMTPTIFLDDRVAVTPMGPDLRFGGTMEIGGINEVISMKRVKGIFDSIPRYYPEMRVTMPAKQDVWSGLRPCSPDGLPFIGRIKSVDNLIIATGHGMMGISLAPATGKLVADLTDVRPPSVNISAFRPDRFS